MDPFALLAATWPAAETRRLGPWTIRRGAGGGNRVSAVTLDGPLSDLQKAEAAQRAWGQRPLFQLRPYDEALDAALAARGYARRDPTLILAGSTASLALTVPDERTIFCDGPLASMAALWAVAGIGPERLAVMERAAGPKIWLLGRLGNRPAAAAFVALRRDAAMLHALEVAPAARRQGLGALLTRAAATWSRDRGAHTLALAVTEANGPARALYARLGLAEISRYHYRLAPEHDP